MNDLKILNIEKYSEITVVCTYKMWHKLTEKLQCLFMIVTHFQTCARSGFYSTANVPTQVVTAVQLLGASATGPA